MALALKLPQIKSESRVESIRGSKKTECDRERAAHGRSVWKRASRLGGLWIESESPGISSRDR